MAGEQEKAQTPAQQGAGDDKAKAADTQPSGTKTDGVNSATKSDEDKALQAKAAGNAGAAAEANAKGVVFDHGEPDPFVEQQRKDQLEASKDPWGTTPIQMRDSHDEAVDPAKVGIATRADGSGLVDEDGNPKARPAAPSGIEPGLAGDDAPQGTLPPV